MLPIKAGTEGRYHGSAVGQFELGVAPAAPPDVRIASVAVPTCAAQQWAVMGTGTERGSVAGSKGDQPHYADQALRYFQAMRKQSRSSALSIVQAALQAPGKSMPASPLPLQFTSRAICDLQLKPLHSDTAPNRALGFPN